MQHRHKILPLQDLADVVASARSANQKIVHCHGVFDLLHVGHIRHFSEAKSLGDLLVVTLTPDRYVDEGPDRPVFTQDLRAEAIAALQHVDFVAINDDPMPVHAIGLLRPHLYVKVANGQGGSHGVADETALEEEAVKAVGGALVFTNGMALSSSRLLNDHFQALPHDAEVFLASFRERHRSGDVLQYLDAARDLKVLVVGEAIVDEYLYCEAIGKSEKEPVLASRVLWSERYAGGTLAVANHIAGFCYQVGLLTFLGDHDSQEEFIRGAVRSNIEPVFLHKKKSPTIMKSRFIDCHRSQKLFEVYTINDDEVAGKNRDELCSQIERLAAAYDIVLVVDYGHGMIPKEAVDVLCTRSRFLAVNTQSNAGNKGYNCISKYSRADYICLAKHEIALEARRRDGDLRDLARAAAERLSCERIVITRGKNGSLGYRAGEGFCEVPALSHRVVDSVGAGDAVISLTSLCALQGAPMEILCLVGNAVGAQAVTIVGNKESIQRPRLIKYLESLLA